jgi:hypothetical protein
VAAAQVLVYIGAISVLVLFAIMLTQTKAAPARLVFQTQALPATIAAAVLGRRSGNDRRTGSSARSGGGAAGRAVERPGRAPAGRANRTSNSANAAKLAPRKPYIAMVIVADDHGVVGPVRRPPEQLDELDLGDVGVLELVAEEVAELALPAT